MRSHNPRLYTNAPFWATVATDGSGKYAKYQQIPAAKQKFRVRRAQCMLETMAYPVERIAHQVGFGSPTSFRDQFRRLFGTSPHAYRRAFRGSDQGTS